MIADLKDLEDFTIFVTTNYRYDDYEGQIACLNTGRLVTFSDILKAYNLQRP